MGETKYTKLLAAWGSVLGALAVIATAYVSFRYYISVPFEDQWQTIAELADGHGRYTLPVLWSLHNEHRQPFSRLFLMADLYWFRGQNISLFIEIYLLEFAHLLVFAWALRRLTEWPRWMIAMASGLTCFALFWTSQWESFLNPVQGCYLAAFLFGTVSLLALLFASEQPLWMGVSIAAAFVSEGNLANGLLLWPLLLVAAVRFRLRVGSLVVAAALCIGLYLFGYHRTAWHANPVESLGKPLLVTKYLLVYFGSAWSRISLAIGEMLAAVGVLIAVGCYARELLRPVPKRFAVFTLSLCMFMLGTGLMTALGRLHQLSDTVPSRYQTVSLLFWLCLGLYALDVAGRNRVLAAGVVLFLATAIVPSLPGSLQGAKDKAEQVEAAALPVFADVNDLDAMKAIYPDPALVFAERSFLLARHTAFYADARHKSLGAASSFPAAQPCPGTVERVRPVPDPQFPGWEVTGRGAKRCNRLVAVTEEGTISGIGSASEDSWRVYIRGGGNVKIYGLVDGGRTACLLTAMSLPY